MRLEQLRDGHEAVTQALGFPDQVNRGLQRGGFVPAAVVHGQGDTRTVTLQLGYLIRAKLVIPGAIGKVHLSGAQLLPFQGSEKILLHRLLRSARIRRGE